MSTKKDSFDDDLAASSTVVIEPDLTALKEDHTEKHNITQEGSKKFFLVHIGGAQQGEALELESSNLIGQKGCSINLNNPSISHKHCELLNEKGVLSIKDLGSTNGTFVEGQRIHPNTKIAINEGDVIVIGTMEFQIVGDKNIDHAADDLELESGTIPLQNHNEPQEQKIEATDPVAPKPTTVPKFNGQAAGMAVKKNHLQKNSRPKKKMPFGKKSKKKLKLTMSGDTDALLIPRFFALAADVALTIILYKVLFSLEMVQRTHEQVEKLSYNFLSQYFHLPMVKDVVDIIWPYFPYIALFFLHTSLFILLSRVTLSQLCLGMTTHTNFLWSRLGGIIRNALGLVTLPFLIFDFPVILGRRSFKEVVSFTHLSVSPGVIQTLKGSLYLGIVFIGLLLSPLLNRPEFIQGKPITDYSKITMKEKGRLPATLGNEIASKSLKLKTFLTPRGQMTYFPQFSLVQEKDKKKLLPQISFYHPGRNLKGNLTYINTLFYKELFLVAKKWNPVFEMKFPLINQFIQKQDGKWTPGHKKEAIRLVRSFFNIKIENIWEHVVKFGPFIQGHVDAREHILEKLPQGPVKSVSTLKVSDHHFLKLEVPGKSYLLNVGDPYGILYELQVKGNSKRIVFEFSLIQNVFNKAQFIYPEKLVKSPKNEESESPTNFSAFHIHELVLNNKSTLLESQVEEIITRFYRRILEEGASVLASRKTSYINHFESQLNQFINSFDYVVKRGKNNWSVKIQGLKNDLQEVSLALEKSNESFFVQNQESVLAPEMRLEGDGSGDLPTSEGTESSSQSSNQDQSTQVKPTVSQ